MHATKLLTETDPVHVSFLTGAPKSKKLAFYDDEKVLDLNRAQTAVWQSSAE